MYFKPYASCRWTHAAIGASLDLMKVHKLSSSDISSVHVRTFTHAASLRRGVPTTPDEAEYNLTWPLAAGMINGRIYGEQLSPSSLNDQKILDLQKLISVEVADEYDEAFPNKIISEVIICANGKTYASGPREAPWEASNPPTDKELEDKFIALCEPIIGIKECLRLINLILKLDTTSGCTDLFLKKRQVATYSAPPTNVHIHYL